MTNEAIRIAVIGAGWIGLSSSICIQQNLRSNNKPFTIAILADQLSPNTTGNVAAGIIRPHAVADTEHDFVSRWTKATQSRLAQLFRESGAKAGLQWGVQMIPYYSLSTQSTCTQDNYCDTLPSCSSMTPSQVQLLCDLGINCKSGNFCEIFSVHGDRYLQSLQDEFLGQGGKIYQRKVTSFEELFADFDIIVNCAGLGAKQLCSDNSLRPMRGHVLRVHAPWIKFGLDFYEQEDVYILPSLDFVVLGGCHEVDNWNTKPLAEQGQDILDRCVAACPSLRGVQVLSQHVGLRPWRPTVRLEIEKRAFISHGDDTKDDTSRPRQKPIVHNYGHGGSGVTLHWGCALDASQLVLNLVNEIQISNIAKSKL